MRKNNTYIIILILAIITLSFLGIYKCPIKYLFGIPCPTCGMTRAFYSIFSLDIKKAFYYHALWPIVIIGIIVFILYKFKIIKLKQKDIDLLIYLLIFLLLFYYIYRHITHSPIVKINIQNSLILKKF